MQLIESIGFKKLTREQMEGLDYLFETPAKDEIPFFKQIAGHTPTKVRNLVAADYVKRFKPYYTEKKVREMLVPCMTWMDLETAYIKFVRNLRDHYEMRAQMMFGTEQYEDVKAELGLRYENERIFWDKMRCLVQVLPKREEFDEEQTKRQKLAIQRPQEGWNYITCSLCWRTFPYNPAVKRKTGFLCFKHDVHSQDSIYRRHRRLSGKLRPLMYDIGKRVAPLFQSAASDAEARRLEMRMLTAEDSPLPKLAAYLRKADHSNDPESILRAFHGPFLLGVRHHVT